MEKKKKSLIFKILRWILGTFYPKIKNEGTENLPDEASIIVANHSQMHGPIICEFYSPRESYTWCAGQMMEWKKVPSYAFEDFWSRKPKRSLWFYKILSYLITPLSVCIFNNANTIGVYRDKKIISTFKNTVNKLKMGADVVIFPEHDVEYNNIIYDFENNFIEIAKLYYKKTGKELYFVPAYIAPKLKRVYYCKPIRFNAKNPIEAEKERICSYLKNEITKKACSLPEHTVVPYRNIPKKCYPKNTVKEVPKNEKTCC